MNAPTRFSPLRVAVVAPEPVGALVCGPGIRAMGLARELSAHFSTTLLAPEGSEPQNRAGYATVVWSRDRLGGMLAGFDVVVSQGTEFPARHLARGAGSKPIHVMDLSDPILLEHFASGGNGFAHHDAEHRHLCKLTGFLLQRADFLLCTSERQRDFWLGALYRSGRFAPAGAGVPARAEALLGTVPFGHPGGPPLPPAVKGSSGAFTRFGPIGPTDRILLWNGGVWNWLDPVTLLHAVERLEHRRGDVKLVFLGGRHPAHAAGTYRMLDRAIECAREMRLLGRTVLFNDGWIPYEDLGPYVAAADACVCTAPESLENLFSFRSRLVEAVRFGVPIVCTQGGAMSEFLERRSAGLTVPAGDPAALADVLDRCLQDGVQTQLRARSAASRDELLWSRCAEPLVAFCERIARGEYTRRPEPSLRPWAQYAAYKVPSLLAAWTRARTA